ncbi:12519_t:CDS:1, partial [Ambispora gerdemannii]
LIVICLSTVFGLPITNSKRDPPSTPEEGSPVGGLVGGLGRILSSLLGGVTGGGEGGQSGLTYGR